jgi:hypothetical protein
MTCPVRVCGIGVVALSSASVFGPVEAGWKDLDYSRCSQYWGNCLESREMHVYPKEEAVLSLL